MTDTNIPDSEDSSDPSSLRLPFVQTAEMLFDQTRIKDGWIFLPVAAAILAVPTAYFAYDITPFSQGGLYVYVGIAACIMVFGGAAFSLALEARWHTPPTERVRERVGILWWGLLSTFPLGREKAHTKTHNVKRSAQSRDGGHIVTRNGRRRQLVQIHGPNTDYMLQKAKDHLSASVGGGADDELNERMWSWWTRSVEHSGEEVRKLRAESAREGGNSRNSEPQKRVLRDVNAHHKKRDAKRRPREFPTYVSVSAHPNDLKGSILGGEEDDMDVEDLLEERVSAVENAFAGVEFAETERVDTAAHIREAAAYWRPGEDYDDDMMDMFEQDTPRGPTPAERVLAPGHFDVDGDVVELGEGHVARTFWFEELPINPDALFHSDLYEMQGVDMSMKSYHSPRDRDALVEELEQIYPYVADEAKDWENDGESLKSITASTPREAIVHAYVLLKNGLTNAWDYSGYVTIRAESRSDLEQATRRVKKTLATSPAETTLKAEGRRQYKLFLSGSPFGRDVFDIDTTGQKHHTVLSGFIGATLPAVSRPLYEPGGLRWGRRTQTWQNVVLDLFKRGSAPHGFTIGTSRSGKTFSVAQILAEWWLEMKGRTLIVFDTQGGFEGLTKLLEGDHYKLGAKEPFNPIAGADAATAEKLIESILHEFSDDPSDYMPAVSEAVRISKQNADPETWNLGDVLKVLLRMQSNPQAFTFKYENEDGETIELSGDGERRKELVDELLEKLSCLRGAGKYSHFVTEKRGEIRPHVTKMAYIDGQNLRDADAAEKSVNLLARIMQVENLVRETNDDVVFLGDEAHVLLQGHLVTWLQKCVREWARERGVMWLISQSPQDFLKAMSGSTADEENHRRTFVEQSAFVQVFRCLNTEPDLLAELDLNKTQIKRVRTKLTTGWSGKGYSECLVKFGDVNGWVEIRVRAAESLARAITYEPEHAEFYGSFWSYVFADPDDVVPVEEDEDDFIERQVEAGNTVDDFTASAGSQTAQSGAVADGGER